MDELKKDVLRSNRCYQGSMIPPSNSIRHLDLGSTRWVLVIEKEVCPVLRRSASSRLIS